MVGKRLSHYEILERLGAGGMGEVYRARDTRLGRDVALKVLPEHLRGSQERIERLEHEARSISQLSHPHICALHDIGEAEGVHFLVMEYLEGETLEERLKRGPLPLIETLEIGSQIADAIDRAHRTGVIHRDLKPGNVMLTRDGVKVLDFGLAKELQAAGEPLDTMSPTVGLTQEDSIIGTLQYMAPEQLEGKEVDHRADVFALGGVLYEMVSGSRPFQAESQAGVIAAILEREFVPLEGELEVLSPILESCLAKDPEERWQSAADVRRLLAGLR